MTDKAIDSKILYYLQTLEKSKRIAVLNYLMGLIKREPKENKNEELISLAGSISKKDIRLMEQAIEEGCENQSFG